MKDKGCEWVDAFFDALFTAAPRRPGALGQRAIAELLQVLERLGDEHGDVEQQEPLLSGISVVQLCCCCCRHKITRRRKEKRDEKERRPLPSFAPMRHSGVPLMTATPIGRGRATIARRRRCHHKKPPVWIRL
jgi:hypothetical protein